MSTGVISAAGAGVRLLVAAFLFVTACGATPPQTPDDTPSPQGDAPPASAGHSLVYAQHAVMVVLVNAGLGGMTSPAASAPTRI